MTRRNIDFESNQEEIVIDGKCSCPYWSEVGLPCRHIFRL